MICTAPINDWRRCAAGGICACERYGQNKPKPTPKGNVMGDIGEGQREWELEPIDVPAPVEVPEPAPVETPDSEPVGVPA